MSKRMLVNAAQEGEVRVATVENSVLEDLNIATDANELLKGNLYKGIVVSVESGLQAAFVDYGSERNGFITFNDIHRRYYNMKTKNDGKRLRIQDAIAPVPNSRTGPKRRWATKAASPPTSHYRVDTLF